MAKLHDLSKTHPGKNRWDGSKWKLSDMGLYFSGKAHRSAFTPTGSAIKSRNPPVPQAPEGISKRRITT
jgi:hypothetical protein